MAESALRPGGSTWRWRLLRAAFGRTLKAAGYLPCARCGKPVFPDDAWQLDHLIPPAFGGTDRHDNLGVSHATCNAQAQARMATMNPSRDW